MDNASPLKQIPYFPNSKEFSNYVDIKDYKYSNKQEYYKFLEILPTANEKEINKAILLAYKRYHPDTGGFFPKEFELLLEIKTILTNSELKRIYDNTGFDKQQLIRVFEKITSDTISCAVQGVLQFENIKIVLIENYKREIAQKNKDIQDINHKVNKIQKVIEDITRSSISSYLIDNLEHEIRAFNSIRSLNEEEVSGLRSLLWIIENLDGKTKIEDYFSDESSFSGYATSGSGYTTSSGRFTIDIDNCKFTNRSSNNTNSSW